MSNVTHLRFEIVRTLRNRTVLAVTLALPLVLFYAVAWGHRHATFDGVSFPLYFMTGMAVYGAMFGAVSPGARVARDRSGGWFRQLRITPLRARTDVAAKVLTAYLVTLPSLALLYLAGASLGVRLDGAPGTRPPRTPRIERQARPWSRASELVRMLGLAGTR